MKRYYYVDVARYQPACLKQYKSAGAKGAIIQVSVGNTIHAPKAHGQVKSAKYRGLDVLAYFYACFGGNATQAEREAKYAADYAEKIGVPKGTYFAVDWEQQDNYIYGSTYNNTRAIMTAMETLKDAGYKPLLYSSASLLRSRIDTGKIIKKYGTCLWVAAYPVAGAVNTPNFGYFPSMDGVALWQFTDNWHGLHVDGNISLIDLKGGSSKPKEKAKTRPEIPSRGTFYLGTALKLHKSAHIGAPALAKLPKGSAIIYDKVIIGPLRTWIRQPRPGNKFAYMVAVDKNKHLLGKITR